MSVCRWMTQRTRLVGAAGAISSFAVSGRAPGRVRAFKYLIVQGAECLRLLSFLEIIETISITCQQRLQGRNKRAAA